MIGGRVHRLREAAAPRRTRRRASKTSKTIFAPRTQLSSRAGRHTHARGRNGADERG